MVPQYIRIRATMFTPSKPLYGEEVLTPEEVHVGSARTTRKNPPKNHIINFKARQSQKLQAASNLSKYLDETRSWRNKQVTRKDIKPGNFVLIMKQTKEGKLQSKWEGPYIIVRYKRKGSFHLINHDDEGTRHTWNANNLRCYYV